MFDQIRLAQKPGEWGFFNEVERDIESVGFATNLTPNVIRQAHKVGATLLLTHHDAWDFLYGVRKTCHELLMQYQITHAFFHTPLDDADFGTAAALAKALGIDMDHKTVIYSRIYYSGIVGRLEPPPFEKLTSSLAAVLGESTRAYKNNNGLVERIGIITGGGNMINNIQQIVDFGCDT